MPITKEQLRAMRPQLQAALDKVAADNGLQSLIAGNISFTADNFTVSVKGIAQGGKTREAMEYEAAALYQPGLPKLGESFRWGAHTFKATGLRRTKVTVIDVNTGKTYTIRLADLEVKFPTKDNA